MTGGHNIRRAVFTNKETGTNISARLFVSLANNESPGIFMAQFDKGRLDRFTYIVDFQTRILTSTFEINGGEKIALFRYAPSSYINDLWIATYSEEDFKKGRVSYSDEFDLVAAWQQLATENEVELQTCVAAALRRGIVSKQEAEQNSLSGDNLAAGFEQAGLGGLAEAMLTADRVIQF